jgi:hypothetical protein
LEGEARVQWESRAPIFIRCGLLKEIHRDTFAEWMELLAENIVLRKEGKRISTDRRRLSMAYSMQFAGTPSSQARVYVAPGKPETKLGSFLGKAS